MSSKAVKILVGVVILVLVGVISLAIYFGMSQANASVSMQGDHNQSKVSQSAGLHILEINNQGDNVGCNSWTVSEYSVILLTFIIISYSSVLTLSTIVAGPKDRSGTVWLRRDQEFRLILINWLHQTG